jgi:hypothetical protein
MDGPTFDDLVKRLTQKRLTRGALLWGVVASAVGGVTAATLAKATAQEPKVTLCHKPGTPEEATISVGEEAVAAHLAHGDYDGACVAPPTETPVPPTETPIPPTETPIPPTETPVPAECPNGQKRCADGACMPVGGCCTVADCGPVPECQDVSCSATHECDRVSHDDECDPDGISCHAPRCTNSGCGFVDTCVPTSEGCELCSECTCNVALDKCVKSCPS